MEWANPHGHGFPHEVPPRTQIYWVLALLAVYWLAMKLVSVPLYGARDLSMAGNLAHYFFALLPSPRNASLLFALCFVIVMFGIAYLLHKRSLYLRD